LHWHGAFLVPELLPKGDLGNSFSASTNIGDVFFH
jgi:hypothetical protein